MKHAIFVTTTSGLALLAPFALAPIQSPLQAQSVQGDTTITVAAEVVADNQAPLEVQGQPADFGRLFVPKGAGNVCLYVIDEKRDALVQGAQGTANPEPGHCEFSGSIAPPIFTIAGEPNTAFQTRLIASTSAGGAAAQLKLTIEDGSDEFIYPHFQDDKGLFTFSPRIRLEVPATASEFAAGDIGTLTAEVSY